MPAMIRQDSPAANRFSRTPAAKRVAATIATTGVVTVASGALDPYQNGDLCLVAEAAAGTAITGGTGGTTPLDRTSLYAIQKLTATTAILFKGSIQGAQVTNLGVAISAGAVLQFGDPLNTDFVQPNIVPMASVAGGAQAGPLD